jgi:hypothetical protein
MNIEDATRKLIEHPQVKYFILGIVPDDGNFRLDAAACISEQDFDKEKQKFLKFRTFIMKEK